MGGGVVCQWNRVASHNLPATGGIPQVAVGTLGGMTLATNTEAPLSEGFLFYFLFLRAVESLTSRTTLVSTEPEAGNKEGNIRTKCNRAVVNKRGCARNAIKLTRMARRGVSFIFLDYMSLQNAQINGKPWTTRSNDDTLPLLEKFPVFFNDNNIGWTCLSSNVYHYLGGMFRRFT